MVVVMPVLLRILLCPTGMSFENVQVHSQLVLMATCTQL